ncbi:MAG: hypothetical protein CVV24_04155 [Ignavibacteriae bacterium HGW-Ignavibacteriae-3]|nr:MAG: hypothetical protein CVV24_04155 [Ignavibacteriae bacterium HGW-Ignavibacteriae-3]
MPWNKKKSILSPNIVESIPLSIHRITALWGFSEAAFGGILHALKIPFTGLFLGTGAVIFITLIAHYSQDKKAILRSTLIVVLVKAFVSPYSPLTAYFAVALQGFMGYLFFSFIKYERIAALLLGFFTLLFSALQKLILLTLLFGTGLWKSIDIFVDFVLSQLPAFAHSISFSISMLIIGIYTGLHVFSGIYVGLKAALIPEWLFNKFKSFERSKLRAHYSEDLFAEKKSHVKKPWWKKSTGIFLFVFLIALMLLSFLSPQLGKNQVYDILFMITRSIVITIIWFSILSPFIVNRFKKFLDKNKFQHASEINDIMALFPDFKSIINISWKLSLPHKGIKRIRLFLSDSLALLLFADVNK